MPFNPGGIFTLPEGYRAVDGQIIRPSQHNPPLEDIANALSMTMIRDGRSPMVGDLQMNGFRVRGASNATDPTDMVTLAQVQSLIAAVSSVPTGSVQQMTGSSVPSGYVAANGASLSRTTYAALWVYAQASGNISATQAAKTKGQYGPGNGTTTFSVPDLRDEFIRGSSTANPLGRVQAGEVGPHNHTATSDTTGAHTHALDVNSSGSSNHGHGGGGLSAGMNNYAGGQPVPASRSTQSSGSHNHIITVNNSTGAETRPQNIALHYVIKV